MPTVRAALLELAQDMGVEPTECFLPSAERGTEGLIVSTATRTPVLKRNFRRTFYELIKREKLPQITLHAARHTTATMLKDMNVPIRDAQTILGHASAQTTQQIYQHGSYGVQREAISSLSDILTGADSGATPVATPDNCCQKLPSGQEKERGALGRVVSYMGCELGESGEIRTLDTGLKSGDWSLLELIDTPVIRDVKERSITRLLGCVAVRNCCQITGVVDNLTADISDYLEIVRICDNVIARRCKSIFARSGKTRQVVVCLDEER